MEVVPLHFDELDVPAGFEGFQEVVDHYWPFFGAKCPDEKPLVDYVETVVPAPEIGDGCAHVVGAEV